MRRSLAAFFVAACLAAPLAAAFAQPRVPAALVPDRTQPIDEAATAKIREYTTAPEFNSPLTDYLPASATVPSPSAVLGDVAGAPNVLPYAADVHRYFRLLAEATPRVQVFSIGKSEEGRERIVVAVSSEENLKNRADNDARLAQLADPRTLGLDDAKAEPLFASTVPVYYITGTIHSPETGSPTALMELAYRLAVDESPYVRDIREHVITLITPVVEVDGRERMVDVYRWHLAHPDAPTPELVYWGKYVAHDNNRDAMALTLSLSRQVLDTYLGWHAQVLHDLHESVPFLYDNTVGDGPYNAWVDPILTNEWQLFGWSNVAEMTKMGMPGVYTHGYFDTWSPGYLMFMAAMHNGVSRLYETFGNGGADTVVRELDADESSRTWYRQDPPYPQVKWSQRNNNNYQQTGLLVSLAFTAQNRELLLRNFWQKGKRSVEKPTREGPAAYVLPGDAKRPGAQAELLRVLQAQHVEITRAESAFTVEVPSVGKDAGKGEGKPGEAKPGDKAAGSDKDAKPAPAKRTFPAGTYVVRMDQPYSRIADALLDRQYWSPDDPQKTPYDDTGWSFGDTFGTEVVRVTDARVLEAKAKPVDGAVKTTGGISGSGAVHLVAQRGDDAMMSLRYALGDAKVEAAMAGFSTGKRNYLAGTWIVRGADADALRRAAEELGVAVDAVAAAPKVATRPVGKPRLALLHTWQWTQSEGWWRQRLDLLKVPYDYISTQDVAATPDLRARYDAILFPPVGIPTSLTVNGAPTAWGEPLPWKVTPETPNLTIDETDDMRPGLGFAGLVNLRAFVEKGGTLIAAEDAAQLLVERGFTPGVRVADSGSLKVVGSILQARFPDAASPIADGLGDRLAVYSAEGMSFELSNAAFRGWARPGADRPTGRGGPKDEDVVIGRPAPPKRAEAPKVERWEATPLSVEQVRDNAFVIPEKLRPRTLLRFGDADELLLAGLLEHGGDLAQKAAVVRVPLGQGQVVLFAINPIWRGETIGTHPLVWNALLAGPALAHPTAK
jgi:hypothetical protein